LGQPLLILVFRLALLRTVARLTPFLALLLFLLLFLLLPFGSLQFLPSPSFILLFNLLHSLLFLHFLVVVVQFLIPVQNCKSLDALNKLLEGQFSCIRGNFSEDGNDIDLLEYFLALAIDSGNREFEVFEE
jgi:hypothetical protein